MAGRERRGRQAGAGAARVARFLARGPARAQPAARDDRVVLEGTAGGAVAVEATVLAAMCRRGLVARRGDEHALTADGRAFARRAACAEAPHAAQHRDLETATIAGANGRERVLVNRAESPLGQLARLRRPDGAPFLTAAELAAGERLRADYDRGRIMPRLGANWEAAVAGGRRAGGARDLVELHDAALAARRRVERALEAVGPDLSGVLVDVCCFLKGLGQVEAERGWPVRSGKLMLKTALAVLARHYAPPPEAGPGRRTLHWGGAGYRPTISR